MSRLAIAAVGVLAVAIALVIVVTSTAAPPAPLPTLSPTAAASPSAAPSVRISPTATPAAGAATLQATAARVPVESHYVVAGTGVPSGGAASFRVVLLDPEAHRATDVASVAVPVPPGSQSPPRVAVSASADGRTLVAAAMHPSLRETILALDVEAGTARLLADGPGFGPVPVSPDGRSFAFARSTGGLGGDPAVEGIWVGAVAGGVPRRLVASEPGRVGSPPVPLAFLPAGTQLAIRASAGEGSSQVALVGTAAETRFDASTGEVRFSGGDVRVLGRGTGIDAGDGRSLLLWSSRDAFGGSTFVSTFDLATGATREVFRPEGDRLIPTAAWHPARDRYVVVESPFCCGLQLARTVTVRRLDGTVTQAAQSPFVGEVWWSRDGAKLYATSGGDDATANVVDLLSGAVVVSYCLRGSGPPCP